MAPDRGGEPRRQRTLQRRASISETPYGLMGTASVASGHGDPCMDVDGDEVEVTGGTGVPLVPASGAIGTQGQAASSSSAVAEAVPPPVPASDAEDEQMLPPSTPAQDRRLRSVQHAKGWKVYVHRTRRTSHCHRCRSNFDVGTVRISPDWVNAPFFHMGCLDAKLKPPTGWMEGIHRFDDCRTK